MNKLWKQIKIIYNHRKYVRKACWNMGIFVQGLLHDLSKYTPSELTVCKYYNGKKSPHAYCRDIYGYSPYWPRHYHRNKHHWQYWLDIEDWPNQCIAIKMPYKYVIEMFCDFIGAGKAYNPKSWTPDMPINYWKKACEGKRLQHVDTTYLFVKLLEKIKVLGERNFYKWYKKNKQYLKDCYEAGRGNY